MRMTCKEISRESGLIPIPDKIRNAIECKPRWFNNIKTQHCFYGLKMSLGPLFQTYSIFLEAEHKVKLESELIWDKNEVRVY